MHNNNSHRIVTTFYSSSLLLLLLLPYFFVCHIAAAGSNKRTTTTTTTPLFRISPIKHWEPSWVASSVQTAVTVPCHIICLEDNHNMKGKYDCVALILRSSSASSSLSLREQTWKEDEGSVLKQEEDDDDEEKILIQKESSFLLQQCYHPSSNCIGSTSSCSFWTPLAGNHMICAMTGFQPDIEHVYRIFTKI